MRVGRGFAVTILFCSISLAVATGAKAADTRTIDEASAQEIVDGMANKMVRGVTNFATGWLEIPKQIYLTYHEDGAAKAASVGPVKGIGMALVRTASGAGEALTFFLAYPGFFSPYIDPSYVWQKE